MQWQSLEVGGGGGGGERGVTPQIILDSPTQQHVSTILACMDW